MQAGSSMMHASSDAHRRAKTRQGGFPGHLPCLLMAVPPMTCTSQEGQQIETKLFRDWGKSAHTLGKSPSLLSLSQDVLAVPEGPSSVSEGVARIWMTNRGIHTKQTPIVEAAIPTASDFLTRGVCPHMSCFLI